MSMNPSFDRLQSQCDKIIRCVSFYNRYCLILCRHTALPSKVPVSVLFRSEGNESWQVFFITLFVAEMKDKVREKKLSLYNFTKPDLTYDGLID